MQKEAFMRLGLVSAGLLQPECVDQKKVNEELKELEKQMMAMVDPYVQAEKRDQRQQHKLAVKYSNRKKR